MEKVWAVVTWVPKLAGKEIRMVCACQSKLEADQAAAALRQRFGLKFVVIDP